MKSAEPEPFRVTNSYSAEQTKQLLVYDKSKIADVVREVIETGRLLDDKEKTQVAKYYVNYS